MNEIREPIQKRAIEKKQKISEAGFKLFCEKGYYKTNTIEIAKHAGVSTGTLYSYFKDKRHIYIAAFEQYLNSLSSTLFEKLRQIPKPFNLSAFIENWISVYVDLYTPADRTLMQLKIMILDDDEINHHFSDLENKYFSEIVTLLHENNITPNNILEKVYASCILIDSLRQEKSTFHHSGLNFDILKNQIIKAIITIFKN